MRAADSGSASATFISTPTRRIGPRCCARAASGHAAAPPSSVTSSRRRISTPRLGDGILAAQMSTLIGAKRASKPLPQRTADVAVGSKAVLTASNGTSAPSRSTDILRASRQRCQKPPCLRCRAGLGFFRFPLDA
jgi:hypothetical protein